MIPNSALEWTKRSCLHLYSPQGIDAVAAPDFPEASVAVTVRLDFVDFTGQHFLLKPFTQAQSIGPCLRPRFRYCRP